MFVGCQPEFLDVVGDNGAPSGKISDVVGDNGAPSGKISSISNWQSSEQPKNLIGNFKKFSGFFIATDIFTRGGYILLVCLNRIIEISIPVKSTSDAFI